MIISTNVRTVLTALAAAALTGASTVQAQQPAPPPGTYQDREQNQQDRIANGEKNGTLTPGQAAHLENREAKTENQEKADMAAHNGHLTKAEQNKLNKEQNKTSKEIYKDKHDAK